MKQLFSLLFTLMSLSGFSSHYWGGEISARYIGDSTGISTHFAITIIHYVDTSALQMPNSLSVRINSNAYASSSQSLNLVSVQSNAIDCNQNIASCTYKGYIILPGYNAFYTISSLANARTSIIDNIDVSLGSSNFNIYLEVTIHPENNPLDYINSPKFIYPPNITIHANQTSTIDFPAFPNGGDSLWYELVDAKGGANANNPIAATYNSNYSGAAPFDSSTTTVLNPHTGSLTVTNPNPGNYVVAMKVSSFQNGQIKTSIMRDILIKVDGNTNLSPLSVYVDSLMVSSGNYNQQGSTFFIEMFEGGSMHAKINASANTSSGGAPINLNMAAHGKYVSTGSPCNSSNCAFLSGQTNGTSGLNADLIFQTDSTIIPNSSNSYTTSLSIKTSYLDSCGVENSKVIVFNIRIIPSSIHINKYSDTICYGDSTHVNVSGANTNLQWSPITGISNPFGPNVSLFPDSSTIYTVTNLADGASQSIQVIVEQPFSSIKLKNDGYGNLSIPSNKSAKHIYWNFFGLPISNSTEVRKVNALMEGQYSAMVDFKSCGDVFFDTLNVDHFRQISFSEEATNFTYYPTSVSQHQFRINAVNYVGSITDVYFATPAGLHSSTTNDYKFAIEQSNGVVIDSGMFVPVDSLISIYKYSLTNPVFLALGDYLTITISAATNTQIPTAINFLSNGSKTDSTGTLKISNAVFTDDVGSKTYDTYPYIAFQLSSGIEIDESENQFVAKVFPNPIKNQLNLNIDCDKDFKAEIKIMSTTGAVVWQQKEALQSGENLLSYPLNLASGNYILNIETATGDRIVRKLSVVIE